MAKLMEIMVEGQLWGYQFWCVKCEKFHAFDPHRNPIIRYEDSPGGLTVYSCIWDPDLKEYEDMEDTYIDDNDRMRGCHVYIERGILRYVMNKGVDMEERIPMVDAHDKFKELSNTQDHGKAD